MIVAACIIVHHPDVPRLVARVQAVVPQFGSIVVVVDGCADVTGIANALRGSAHVLPAPHGTGAGAAMNLGVGWLADRGADAVMVLGQDAAIDEGSVSALSAHLDDPLVAIAAGVGAAGGGAAGGGRAAVGGSAVGGSARYVDACAMSGSVVRVAAWRALDGWDDAIAGEYAGYDLCLRVRRAGSAIVQDPSVLVRGVVAVPSPSPSLVEIAHDSVYFARKHRSVPPSIRVAGRGVLHTYGALVLRVLGVVRHETDRRVKVRSIVRGALAGSMARLAA